MKAQRLEEIRPRIQALEAMPAVPAIVLPLTAMLHSPTRSMSRK